MCRLYNLLLWGLKKTKCLVSSSTNRRVGFYGFGVIILEDSSGIVFQKLNIVIPACAQLRRILILFCYVLSHYRYITFYLYRGMSNIQSYLQLNISNIYTKNKLTSNLCESAFVYTTTLVRIDKHSCTYIKVGREGNKHGVWDPFPLINLLPSHPFDTRISTFWTYIKCTTHN